MSNVIKFPSKKRFIVGGQILHIHDRKVSLNDVLKAVDKAKRK